MRELGDIDVPVPVFQPVGGLLKGIKKKSLLRLAPICNSTSPEISDGMIRLDHAPLLRPKPVKTDSAPFHAELQISAAEDEIHSYPTFPAPLLQLLFNHRHSIRSYFISPKSTDLDTGVTICIRYSQIDRRRSPLSFLSPPSPPVRLPGHLAHLPARSTSLMRMHQSISGRRMGAST
jgi:hypothetical protein